MERRLPLTHGCACVCVYMCVCVNLPEYTSLPVTYPGDITGNPFSPLVRITEPVMVELLPPAGQNSSATCSFEFLTYWILS